MRAVILAGGRGRRLAPYTVAFPKPLVPVGEMPILEIVLRQLRAAGFQKATLAVGHLAELIMAFFAHGDRVGMELDYVREDQPLGTVGPLAALDDLPENFLVMNGDILTTLSYDAFFAYHCDSKCELTIACHHTTTKVDLGVVEFDGSLQVTGYREKPILTYDASMGIYAFNRSVLDAIEHGIYLDFPTLIHRLISQGRKVKVFLSDAQWLDIGRPEDHENATKVFEENRNLFLPIEDKPTALHPNDLSAT